MDEWDNYLLKYRNLYRVKKDVDGIYKINCWANRLIAPYSIEKGLLVYTLLDAKSSEKKDNLKRLLQKEKIWFEISQEGDTEASFVFSEQDLEKIAGSIHVVKRRVTNPQQRQDNIAQLLKYRQNHQRQQHEARKM